LLRTSAIAFLLFLASIGALAQTSSISGAGTASTRLSSGDHVAVLAGMSFHYVVAGSGPLLVVQAPGWGIGSAYLRNGLAPLEKHFTVLTFDPRGSGLSSRSLNYQLLSNSDMVDDLEHLRKYWGLETINLIGHSNGGAIAVGYAERYPTHVRKLLLVGSELSGYPGKEGTQEQDAWRRKDPDFAHAMALLDAPEPKEDAAFTQWFRDTAPYYLYDPGKNATAFLVTVTAPLTAAATSVYLSNAQKTRMPPISALAMVEAQTLILVGRQDPTCPVMVSEKLHEGIQGSTLLVYEQTGHFPWIEQPSDFIREVAQFFQQQTSHAEVKPQSSGIVHTSDTDIAYEQFGRDAGHTPALIVNGGPGSSHTYMCLTDVFTKQFAHNRSVTFYDQRGIGKSKLQRESAPEGIEAHVADLEGLRAKLGYNKVDLIGHSWGGNIVMAYAAAYPQHVQHLVLIDSRAPASGGTLSLVRQVYPDQLADDKKTEKGSNADEKSEAEMIRRSLARTFYSQDKFNDVIGKLSDDEVVKVQSADINKAVGNAIKSLDLTDSLKKFDFPTLIMWGRFDMGIAVQTGWEISQAIPKSRMVIYAKSGHYPFYEQESQFLRDLNDFLDK